MKQRSKLDSGDLTFIVTMVFLLVMILFGTLAHGKEVTRQGKTTQDYVTEINQLERVRHTLLRKYGEMHKTEENTKTVVGAVLNIDILIFKLYVEKDEVKK